MVGDVHTQLAAHWVHNMTDPVAMPGCTVPLSPAELPFPPVWSPRTLAGACTVTALTALLLIWAISRSHSTARRAQLDAIPCPPRWPVLGHLPYLMAPFHRRLVTDWAGKYGGLMRLRVLGFDAVVISDPEVVSQALGGHGLPKHVSQYQNFNLLWGSSGQAGLFSSPADDYWRAVRKSVAVAFCANNIRKKFVVVQQKACEVADRLAERGAGGAPVDVDDAGLRLTLDVIGLVAFGHDFGAAALEPCGVCEALPAALTEAQARLTNPLRRWLPPGKMVREWWRITAELAAVVRKRLPLADDDLSIAAQLLRVKDPATGAPLSNAQLQVQVATLLVGGFETTGHTLAFTLLLLAAHPAAQAAVVEEMASHNLLEAAAAGALVYDDLARLDLMSCVLKESMRMFPVGVGSIRVTEEETQLGGYTLPARLPVLLTLHALHNSTANWADPDRFEPERWQLGSAAHTADAVLPKQAEQQGKGADSGNAAAVAGTTLPKQATTRKFLPFSEGPRACPGQAMALMELKTALAVLLARFSFSLPPGGSYEEVVRRVQKAMTLHVPGGIPLVCAPRVPAPLAREE